MKFEIYFKKNLDLKIKNYFKKEIQSIMEREEFIYKLKHIEKEKVIFSVGGDGTFLEAINKYGTELLYIPINAGTLGFYTSWNRSNIENLNESIKLMEVPLLNVRLNNKMYYSINEITIINPINTQIMFIKINGQELEHFRGTGICISTPTGSTAYNKSLGGAIIDFNMNLFQLVKIAPINNIKYRTISNPIILSTSDIVSLPSSGDNYENSIITIDRNSLPLKGIKNIEVGLANKKLKILSNDINFWSRIREKFIEE